MLYHTPLFALVLAWLLQCCKEHATAARTPPAISDAKLVELNEQLNTVYPGKATVGSLRGKWPKDHRDANFSVPYKFSFPGSGFLGIYSVGVAQRLAELNALHRDSHMYAASSGGQLAGAYCSGANFTSMIESVRELVTSCANETFGCWGEVSDRMIPLLEKTIPEPEQNQSSEAYPNCRNTVISVSRSKGTSCNPFGNQSDFGLQGTASFITNFTGKSDMIDTILATSYIPGFSGPECYILLRGEPVVDGGFVANTFCPTGDCVIVNVFPPWWPPGRQEVDIYPGLRDGSLLSWPLNLIEWSLARYRPDIVADHFDEIIEYARKDAEYWFRLQQPLVE